MQIRFYTEYLTKRVRIFCSFYNHFKSNFPPIPFYLVTSRSENCEISRFYNSLPTVANNYNLIFLLHSKHNFTESWANGKYSIEFWGFKVLAKRCFSVSDILWYRESIVVDFEFSFKLSIVGSPDIYKICVCF